MHARLLYKIVSQKSRQTLYCWANSLTVGGGGGPAPALLRSLLFLYIGKIKKLFQWDYYTVFETNLGEFYVKILFRDCHEIVKQLQTVLPLQRKLLMYMCMCIYVYMCTCVYICIFVHVYFLYAYIIYLYNILMEQRWLTAQLGSQKYLLSKFNLRPCSVSWSSGENRYGKTNIKKKNFIKRS